MLTDLSSMPPSKHEPASSGSGAFSPAGLAGARLPPPAQEVVSSQLPVRAWDGDGKAAIWWRPALCTVVGRRLPTLARWLVWLPAWAWIGGKLPGIIG